MLRGHRGIDQGPDVTGDGQRPSNCQGAPSPFYLTAQNTLKGISAFPYSGEGLITSVANVLMQSLGLTTNATAVAAQAANFAISQSATGQITLYLFSGGAQAANTAWQNGLINEQNIQYVVYVEPGLPAGGGSLGGAGLQPILSGTDGTFTTSDFRDIFAIVIFSHTCMDTSSGLDLD